MIEREITFDAKAHSVDAIQRAIYRLSDRLSCDLTTTDTTVRCTLYIRDPTCDADEIVADFRNEVLDQTLRERIRAETHDVRNLILALAFSNTGLAHGDEA